jgi:hypothetical protein
LNILLSPVAAAAVDQAIRLEAVAAAGLEAIELQQVFQYLLEPGTR